MFGKTDSLAAARKLVRTFASAPDPRRQARLILETLRQAEGWPPALEDRIAGFSVWLATYPPVGELRARSADLVAHFPEPTQPFQDSANQG